jgi:hypothetical protein
VRKIVALSLVAIAIAALPARAAELAGFRVGVATVNIDPPRAQYLGGFGFDDPVSAINDPLEVRAFAISNGTTLVEFAIVDTQGYFAGYQEGPWGSRDARLEAARQIAQRDIVSAPVTDANIIVSSTHSHAAPTIMGIWGTTDVEYLKQVYEGTVKALVDAAAALRPADLYAGTADIATVTIEGVTQTDGYQGWRAEGDTPVLVARDPGTHEIIGLYANVPTHADIVEGIGIDKMSADHIGFERAELGDSLGGTAVVAMGTLGRQETIVQVDGLAAAHRVASFVNNEIETAIANAKKITSTQLAAAQQYMLLPATNPALTALNVGNVAAEAAGPGDVATHCAAEAICTIDRSILPPYAAGASFGVWFTAFRIGDIAYATEPGEAFPEVSAGIRNAMGAADVRVVGMAQDQLGYYFPPETLPFTGINNSDHHIYNASLLLGEANVQAHALNAVTLGFTTVPPVVHETNQYNDVDASRHAGVQFYPVDREAVAGTTFTFEAVTSNSAIGELSFGMLGTGEGPDKITWDYGDGQVAVAPRITTHTYPSPGAYTITASIVDPDDGSTRAWRQKIIVDPPLTIGTEVLLGRLAPTLTGGQGSIIAARWRWQDAVTTYGTLVEDRGMPCELTVVDGAGNSTSIALAAGGSPA